MSKVKKVVALVLIFVLVFSLVGCSAKTEEKSAQKPIVIRWSYDMPANGSMSIVPETFKKLVDADESLKGKVEVQLYPSSQLYKPAEALDAVMRGDVEFISLANWYLASLSPKITLFDLPFLFKDIKSMNQFLSSPLANEIWAPLEAKGIKVVASAATGTYSIITNGKEVKLPQDMKGVKIRSLGDGSLTWLAMDAAPVDLPAGDIFTAMQRKMIDAADIGPVTVKERNLFEVTKYYMDTFIHSTVITQLVNKKFWDNMSPDIKDKLSAHLKAAEKKHQEAVPELVNQYIKEMAEKGVKIYTLQPQERDIWLKAVEPVFAKLGEKVGLDYIAKIKESY